MNKAIRNALALAAALLSAIAGAAPGSPGALAAAMVAGTTPPAAVSLAVVDAGGASHTVIAGRAPAGPALQATTAFRTASNTKVYTAAAILRLWEDGRLGLDDSIRKHVDPAYLAALDGDGYDTARITVRQLLSHTAGLADHAQTKQFMDTITTQSNKAWSRADHLDALVRWTDPVAAPGAKFAYADPGYQLLGNIIERITGQPLAAAVRALLRFDELGLHNTYWEALEAPGAKTGARAHQFLRGHDTHGWHPSLDLYGGGGLVASPEDMARFLFLLFEGQVFKKPATLAAMISTEGLPAGSVYRLGLFEYDAGGVKAYGHSGFWGTAAMYVPSQRRAIAFALTHQEAFKPAFEAFKAYGGQAAK